MDKYQTVLRGEIAAYGQRLEALREEIATLTVRREALEHALAVYEETKPPRQEHRNPLGRAGSQTAFVLNAIRESGTQGLTTGDIYAKIAKAGLSMQPATVRALLYDRKKKRVLERISAGRYRFPQSSANGADTEKAGDAHLEQGTSPALFHSRPDQPVESPQTRLRPGGGT